MRRIIGSLVVIAGVAALGIFGSQAFFSDTETSVDNKFVAGDIDLKIDNTSYALDFNIPTFEGTPSGALVANPANTWTATDLVLEKFFDFTDVKPGDYGEDTISVHVGSNDAWVCAAAQITEDSDVTYSEPELEDDTTQNLVTPADGNGELDGQVRFAFWKDDGDNVLEVGENTFLSGPISGLNGAGQIALADTSVNSVFGQNIPVPGDTTVYIGKGWCFGTMTPTPLAQDGLGTDGPIGPGRVGTGFTCDGSLVDNAAQTDSVVGDLQFYAVQARNNGAFTCAQNYTPEWPEEE